MLRATISRFTMGVGLVGLLCLVVTGMGPAGAASDATRAATPGSTPSAAPISAEIHYLRFKPDPIEIQAGDTVVWTNQDALPHTVTSVDGGLLKSKTLGKGDTYQQTFAKPGTYDYICLFHAQMKGTVIVAAHAGTEAAATPKPSS